jgi:chromosome partitioning protein
MIIACSSQKGGVGKTASAVALSTCSAAAGYSTLLVDLDPQGACSISLGLDPDTLETTLYDVLTRDTSPDSIIQTTAFGFDLAPSNIDLAEAELALSSTPLREYVFKRRFGAVLSRYDVVYIDTPPTLGLLTINAFAASDSVLIPVSTQLLSLRGLRTLLETIDKLRHYGVNETLAIAGVIPTKYDHRTLHSREVLEHLQGFGKQQGFHVFPPVPATVRFDDAINEQKPFPVAYPDHPASEVYRRISEQLTTQGG